MSKLTFVAVLGAALFAVCFTASLPFSTQKKHDRNDYTKNPHRLICYVGSWAEWHQKPYDFLIEKINTDACTHINYGFAILDEYDYTIKVFDPALDLGKTEEISWAHDGYKRFVNLKERNPELTMMIAIGGWFEGSEKYSDMVKTKERRAKFVASVMEFLEKYGFDGLDVDWEFPANRLGKPEDKENFVHLIEELAEAFKEEGYLLSAAFSPGKPTIDKAYDRTSIQKLNDALDFANVMTYDYHGGFDIPPYLQHNAPLYNRPEETKDILVQFTINYTINYFFELGMKKEKMNMGMPFYGRGHGLKTSEKHHPDDLGSDDMSPAGPATQQEGVLGYDELCIFEQEQSGWHTEYDPYWKAPFAYKDTTPMQWIGYDDEKSLACKVSFLKEKGLGGAMAWSLEFDDFNNNCKKGSWPLLKAVHKYLNGDQKEYMGCPIAPPVTPSPTPSTTTTTTTTTTTPTPTPTEPSTTTTTTTETPETPSPSPSTTTITSTTPDQGIEIIDDEIKCKKDGTYAYPYDKHKYIECQYIAEGSRRGWWAFIRDCATGTRWHDALKTCVAEDDDGDDDDEGF